METATSDTRSVLLQAAVVCFADHGFEGTSIRMIAQRAGRPLSLLSHHFGSKEGLYLAVFAHLLETSGLPRGGGAPPAAQDRQGAIRLLREQIHFLFQNAAPDSSVARPFSEHRARLWLQEARSPRPALEPLITRYLGPIAEVIRGCIRVLRPDLNEAQVNFIGKTIMGQVAGHGALSGLYKVIWGNPPSSESHFQQAELLVDFCLNGLRIGSSAD
jgi:AcrR family transcriptional regulator